MSLRLRLTLALVLVNALVLGSLAWWVAGREGQRQDQEEQRRLVLEDRLAQLAVPRFRPSEIGDLSKMLDWPLWSQFEDALIIDTRVLDLGEAKVPIGTFLNPRGRRHRKADFPLAEITKAVVEATQQNRSIQVATGLAIPLSAYQPFAEEQRPWGGLYVDLSLQENGENLMGKVLLAALASTLVSAFLIVWLLSRMVLRPVERLVDVTRSFDGGGRPRDLPDQGAAEVVNLSRSFGQMMERISGFQGELESEVARATQRAVAADRVAAHRERMAAMGTLAAGVAHEINSPLAGALYGLEVLRREASGAEAAQYGDLMQEALERIRDLVQRLLQLSPGKAEVARCPLDALVEDLQTFLASRLQDRDFEITMPEEGLEIGAARGDLFPLLLNLLQNALDSLDSHASDVRGRIHILAETSADGGCRLALQDNGPGAPTEILPHLFEPFVTSKDVGSGTGLGLALAHATMQRLGGAIEAQNLKAGGFEVILTFPPPTVEDT
ncbi:MAG: ATP-binding protein [Planctomycetota bacterium]